MNISTPGQSGGTGNKPSVVFEFGPDRGADLQRARSYFLVPLLGLNPDYDPHDYQRRIVEAGPGVPYSDIYVFSHGWHRNLFGAVSAYDRLVSRFTSLFQRGRLQSKVVPYHPLFLAMHWHSDPGQDGWVDAAGRRDKTSFLLRAQAVFKAVAGVSEGDFLNTLEDVYEFMTYVSAPNVPALSNPMTGQASTLFNRLDQTADVHGRLAVGPGPKPEDKATLAWRCYEEADAQRVLMDQGEPARPFSSPLQALSNLLKFVIAMLGIAAAFGLFLKLIRWSPLATPADHLLHVTLLSMPDLWQWLAAVAGLLLLALVILLATKHWHQTYHKGKGARGLPVLAVGSWLPLQLALTFPLLLFLFATFLFRTWLILLAFPMYVLCHFLHWNPLWPQTTFVAACIALAYLQNALNMPVGSLFTERVKDTSRGVTAAAPPGIRDTLARLARLPIRLLKGAVSQDSRALDLADAVDRQLAFWEMQRSGVEAGQEAGIFLEDLFQQMAAVNPSALATTRIHLIGHSFGGLVMANAARYLAQNTSVQIHSLTLLEAAIATAWFSTEPWCHDPKHLSGTLACVFSSYDSANGFYYPAANSGRMAAGYVGLCEVGAKKGHKSSAQLLGKDGLFASLVQPPDLGHYVTGDAPYVLNLDASRLIFEGGIASGGGHDDIYKDDVIHMIWAITAL